MTIVDRFEEARQKFYGDRRDLSADQVCGVLYEAGVRVVCEPPAAGGRIWRCRMNDELNNPCRTTYGFGKTREEAIFSTVRAVGLNVGWDVPEPAPTDAAAEAAEAQAALKDAKAVVMRLWYCFRVLQATEAAILSARALEDALGECLRGAGLELVLTEEERPVGGFFLSSWHWEVRAMGEDEINLEMRGVMDTREQAAIVAVRHIRGKASRAIEELCAPFVGAKEGE